MSFYISNSDEFYKFSEYWIEERDFLIENKSRLLSVEEANYFCFSDIFSKDIGDKKPRLNQSYNYFTLPYELDDFINSKNENCLSVILDLMKQNIEEVYYIASTDRDKCCFLETGLIDEEMVYLPYSGHINTPFLIFDKSKSFFIIIDYDLPFQIVGYKSIIDRNNHISYSSDKGLDDVKRRYAHYKNLSGLIEEYYGFLV